ncbi:PQQ-dependent sugar dehydrogenase [Vibrio sp. SCSIO 43136]|uniref:PQQ-dependent sugar dehydrogenase n=1 Tax=Vibrio sp. SCSIO 43136 TaxID=2819101 RepID=UPI0020752784|nr:PQQ-dependent sugar dehydrogenase [Vibrio sp. SCSIO 43136]USD67649.1 PQQ-dependent sugar dehydrogenase [Vibrio sp. SCSIO 43136]
MKFTLALILLLFVAPVQADTKRIAQGFGVIWGIEFINAYHLIVAEKSGQITFLDLSSNEKTPLMQVPDLFTNGQGGLMDVAYHKPSQTLYFTYSKKMPQGTTLALASAMLKGKSLSDWQDIFIADAYSNTSRHFGSRIAIVDQHLFISIGDRGERDNGQDLTNHAASILRLNLDGSVASGNPFKQNPAVWSYGHRNPQGLFYDAPSETLWSIEHGPRGGDEINKIIAGENYGWPLASHGKEYWGPISVGDAKSLPGMKDPLLVYVPSIAPSNLIMYRGDRYPNLNGKLLAGALKLKHINVVAVDGETLTEERRVAQSLDQRIRDITISQDGYIYFSTDSGNIYRL